MGVEIKNLLGKTLTNIFVEEDQVTFTTSEGAEYRMLHYQDCCESVTVEDVIGDIKDLLNSPITMAEEVVSDETPEDSEIEPYDSFTWTFYKLATIKGYVTIRWFGESNGYYSESVDFCQIKDAVVETDRVRGVKRTEIFNNIYEVLARLPLENTDLDCLDRPSACVEIEELFNQELKKRVNAVKTKDILDGFAEDFGIDKENNGSGVMSFNWFAKCTTLKELAEICVRVSEKVYKNKLNG